MMGIGGRGRSSAALFDLMVCGGILALTLPYVLVDRVDHRVALFGVAMAVAVFFRRRWPLGVMLAVSALALLHLVIFGAPDPLTFDVAVLIAMYSVVKYAPRLWHAYVAAGITVTGLVIEQVRHPNRSWWLSAILLSGFCTAIWLVGYTVRTRRIYLASLEERAATAERERDHLTKLAAADERAAIARELHDVVAHSLAVMIVQADGATFTVDVDPPQTRAALETIAATGREALEDMRRIVGVLRGNAPAAGDADRRRATLDEVEALVDRARSAGLRVAHRVEGSRPALSAAEELTVFRVVQEALTNALRHAGPGADVGIDVSYGPRGVTIAVLDDGAGKLATANGAGGHGLVGMRERIAVHGGEFSAGPRLGGGWQVRATVPARCGGDLSEATAKRTSGANDDAERDKVSGEREERAGFASPAVANER
jgi:signal transduction histidine kinase